MEGLYRPKISISKTDVHETKMLFHLDFYDISLWPAVTVIILLAASDY
jgi:hypothetical protein